MPSVAVPVKGNEKVTWNSEHLWIVNVHTNLRQYLEDTNPNRDPPGRSTDPARREKAKKLVDRIDNAYKNLLQGENLNDLDTEAANPSVLLLHTIAQFSTEHPDAPKLTPDQALALTNFSHTLEKDLNPKKAKVSKRGGWFSLGSKSRLYAIMQYATEGEGSLSENSKPISAVVETPTASAEDNGEATQLREQLVATHSRLRETAANLRTSKQDMTKLQEHNQQLQQDLINSRGSRLEESRGLTAQITTLQTQLETTRQALIEQTTELRRQLTDAQDTLSAQATQLESANQASQQLLKDRAILETKVETLQEENLSLKSRFFGFLKRLLGLSGNDTSESIGITEKSSANDISEQIDRQFDKLTTPGASEYYVPATVSPTIAQGSTTAKLMKTRLVDKLDAERPEEFFPASARQAEVQPAGDQDVFVKGERSAPAKPKQTKKTDQKKIKAIRKARKLLDTAEGKEANALKAVDESKRLWQTAQQKIVSARDDLQKAPGSKKAKKALASARKKEQRLGKKHLKKTEALEQAEKNVQEAQSALDTLRKVSTSTGTAPKTPTTSGPAA